MAMFGKVPYDVDASTSGRQCSSIRATGHIQGINQTSKMYMEHVVREHYQYGVKKPEKIGKWAFGGCLQNEDFTPDEVRWRRTTQRRSHAALPRKEKRTSGIKTEPAELALAAGIISFPKGTFSGGAYQCATKVPTLGNQWKDASGTSTTPNFSASMFAALWRGNNPNYSGQMATLMNPPFKTQSQTKFEPYTTSYTKSYASKDQRNVFERLYNKAPSGNPSSAAPRRPASAGGNSTTKLSERQEVDGVNKPKRPQSAIVRPSSAPSSNPWKATTVKNPVYKQEASVPYNKPRRGTNHFGKSIWERRSNKVRDIALCKLSDS